MKYLTAPYLTLMHAFHTHADKCLEQKHINHYRVLDLMREYCTLRLDGGRQSGKTEALVSFASDWVEDGNSIIVMSEKTSYANETIRRIWKHHSRPGNLYRQDEIHFKANVLSTSMRSFLSDGSVVRGRSLSRLLIIIDEPIRCPEMIKFYEAYLKYCIYATMHNRKTENELPLFFVIGLQ